MGVVVYVQHHSNRHTWYALIEAIVWMTSADGTPPPPDMRFIKQYVRGEENRKWRHPIKRLTLQLIQL